MRRHRPRHVRITEPLEMNYAAQKFARVVMGSNNVDSCNRT